MNRALDEAKWPLAAIFSVKILHWMDEFHPLDG